MSDNTNHTKQMKGGFLFDIGNCEKNNDIFLKSYRNGKFKFLQYMIENEMVSDYGHCDRYGNTVIHYGVVNQDHGFLEFFLNHIENDKYIINKKNNKGDTALHVAARRGYHSIADLLVKAGADLSIENNDGMQVDYKDGRDIHSHKMGTETVFIDEHSDKHVSGLADLIIDLHGIMHGTELTEVPPSLNDISITPTELLGAGKQTVQNIKIDTSTEQLFNLLDKINVESQNQTVQDGGAKEIVVGTRQIATTMRELVGGKKYSKKASKKKASKKKASKKKKGSRKK